MPRVSDAVALALIASVVPPVVAVLCAWLRRIARVSDDGQTKRTAPSRPGGRRR